MQDDDLLTTAPATHTLWLIRHLAACARGRHQVPPQVHRALDERGLRQEECYDLLRRLSGLMPAPLAVAPPCCTARSRHEAVLGRALRALERQDAGSLLAALQALADPIGMSPAEAEEAARLIARLGGYGSTVPDRASGRARCSSGNGGDAIARTASETSAMALSSPATRFDLSTPHP